MTRHQFLAQQAADRAHSKAFERGGNDDGHDPHYAECTHPDCLLVRTIAMASKRGVECGPGWKKLYQPLIDLCALYDVQVLQVKEKFGRLRFYVAGGRASELEALIDAAEEASGHTCEECGEDGYDYDSSNDRASNLPIPRATTSGKGWLRTLCAPCRERLGKS